MRLLEFEGKALLAQENIPVPNGYFFRDEGQGMDFLQKLGGRGVLKLQVLSGGRGRAGGVRFVDTSNFGEVLSQMKDMTIGGERGQGFLLEEVLEVKKELYVGFVVDTTRGLPLFLGVARGGVEVEEYLRDLSLKGVCKRYVDPTEGFYGYHALQMGLEMGLAGDELLRVSRVIEGLYRVFRAYDCELAEINPLVVTEQGDVLAADAKIVINDDAMFRQNRIARLLVQDSEMGTDLEREARAHNIHFVDLAGNVAILGIGAGLTMTVMDMVAGAGGKPANFIDTKGGVTKETVEKMTELVLRKIYREPQVKCLVITISLTATQLSSLVLGIAEAFRRAGCPVPVLSVIHAADAAVQEMDLETAKGIFTALDIRIFPQMKELFAHLSDLLKKA